MSELTNKGEQVSKKYKKVTEYVKGSYRPIKVVPGKLRFNFKCHLNAVHDAVEAGEDSIVMCIYFDADNEPILHFLNKKGDVYTDNTLGYWSHENTYYFVREIPSSEFDNVGGAFTSLRSFLVSLVPWYYKIFQKVVI
jgi:hypothetical protein